MYALSRGTGWLLRLATRIAKATGDAGIWTTCMNSPTILTQDHLRSRSGGGVATKSYLKKFRHESKR